jgi:hypothetical protein
MMILTPNGAIKFGILTGILAMFVDASIGHGLFWKNDPYWTYWFTDAFLITMIISLGASIIGMGLWQGIVLIAIQALTLEIYYEFLSPVGLPQEPYWLSHYDIWTTGYLVHFLVYLAGYLLALWIWRRRELIKEMMEKIVPRRIAFFSLITAIIVLLLDGLITHAFLFGTYPGFTFFLQRLILAFVFLFLWNCYVGLDIKGLVSGALLLSLLWMTYNMYLGPLGLPRNFPIYLGYNELWFKIFPGAFVSALVGLFIARRFMQMEEKIS